MSNRKEVFALVDEGARPGPAGGRPVSDADRFFAHLSARGLLRETGPGAGAVRPDLTSLSPASFADELSACLGWRRLDRASLLAGAFAGEALSLRFLREERVWPVSLEGDLWLAAARPLGADLIGALTLALGAPARPAAVSDDDLDAVFGLLTAADTVPAVTAEAIAARDETLDDLRDLAGGAPVVRALDELLRLAVDRRATDIHIEPFEGVLQVRLRIDGLLRPVQAPAPALAKALLSRLKIIAGLDITERRLPQDGRARITAAGGEVDLRVATMPTLHGESAVIRLLRRGAGRVDLDSLGLSLRDDRVLRAALAAPFGMVVVTGPTGSGKTTTLAAALGLLNDASRKIVTIEDPVEYRLPGITQCQVRPAVGLGFAAALRAFVRQDPDVIMVGEMRDAETAHIGVHAALTGHLVLTTLHTNTAAGALTRLVDMGVESYLLPSTLRAVVGQRLVRTLCADCSEPHTITDADLRADARLAPLGFAAGDSVRRPRGCERCGFTGFRGRMAVFEVLAVDEPVRAAMGQRPDTLAVERVARAAGMTTMVEDGVAKCRAGLTTIDEIARVTASL